MGVWRPAGGDPGVEGQAQHDANLEGLDDPERESTDTPAACGPSFRKSEALFAQHDLISGPDEITGGRKFSGLVGRARSLHGQIHRFLRRSEVIRPVNWQLLSGAGRYSKAIFGCD